MPNTTDIPMEDRVEVRRLYLEGHPKTKILKKFKITKSIFEEIISSKELETLSERIEDDSIIEAFGSNAAKADEEIRKKVKEILDSMLDLIKQAVVEGSEAKNKHLFIKDFKGLLDSLDRIKRLDSDKPTDISEQREKKVSLDIAEVMKELKTPEQKKAFLLQQLNDRDKQDNK